MVVRIKIKLKKKTGPKFFQLLSRSSILSQDFSTFYMQGSFTIGPVFSWPHMPSKQVARIGKAGTLSILFKVPFSLRIYFSTIVCFATCIMMRGAYYTQS